ncbi:hypothetical protein FV139_06465 [Parahaliea maris]|uniref:Alpha/beta hydrolase n=1 Tax=Parahaliea maris TaxID=2716870 RepID=A0A5C9A6A5_9GAMM|nr:hypothetical protein [Parahaliea maris]TXS95524.1 hypothetical protein FV139_06465 [Parahaliea maris]
MRRMLQDVLRLQRDFSRSSLDRGTALTLDRWLRSQAPRTEHPRPVITLPGFAAPRSSHRSLRRFLSGRGFVAETFQAGFPRGQDIPAFIESLEEELGERIRTLSERYGCGVSLVGQSAGGLFAREFAARFGDGVDRVVTLAAPTNDPAQAALQNSALEWLVGRVSGAADFNEQAGPAGLFHWPAGTPDIPYVAICSPVDGAVPEPTALIPRATVAASASGAPRENIRVRSSHFGMHRHPLVLLALADRLCQPRDDWQAFDPRDYIRYLPESALRRHFPGTDVSEGGEGAV